MSLKDLLRVLINGHNLVSVFMFLTLQVYRIVKLPNFCGSKGPFTSPHIRAPDLVSELSYV